MKKLSAPDFIMLLNTLFLLAGIYALYLWYNKNMFISTVLGFCLGFILYHFLIRFNDWIISKRKWIL